MILEISVVFFLHVYFWSYVHKDVSVKSKVSSTLAKCNVLFCKMYCTVCIFDTVTALLQNGIHYTHAANSYQFHLMVKTNPRFIVMIWNWAQPYSKLPRKTKQKKKAVGGYRTLVLPILFFFCLFCLVKSSDSLLTTFRFYYLICPWSHSFIFYLTVFSTELSILATSFQFHMVIGKCANEWIDT